MAAFGLAVLLFAALADERHPPFYGFGLAIAWALLAIAAGAQQPPAAAAPLSSPRRRPSR